jgi:cell division protein ZapD
VHKELDQQLGVLQQFQSQPGVDSGRLDTLIHNLAASRNELSHIGTAYLQPLKDSEFLNAIKHRSAIPGGTCEFDLPEYNHWLRQPFARRQQDMEGWSGSIRPVCDAVTELMWLIRESAEPKEKMAINGMYQHSMQKGNNCRLLRVSLAGDSSLFPEISGSQHRFTVRFLEWSTIDSRAVQTGHDVPFACPSRPTGSLFQSLTIKNSIVTTRSSYSCRRFMNGAQVVISMPSSSASSRDNA